MNSQDFRSLQEAYLEVYQLDEEETGRGPRLIDTYDKPPYSDKVKDAPKYKPVIKGPKRKGVIKKEEVDLYDIILSHLLDEGYAETQEAAEVIMLNMSEEWREDIVEAAADQSDKQIEKGVKTTYKAGNVLDNLHQGRSRGLSRLSPREREAKTERMRKRLKTRRDDLFNVRREREDEARAEMKKKYGL